MITIIKEGQTLRCSKNTYDIMYKRMGYEILEQKKETKEPEKEKIKEQDKIVEKKEINEGTKEVVKKNKTTRIKNKKGE